MHLFRFAFKNLGRHRRRTIITTFALAFGIVCYVFTDSLLAGASSETERNFRLYETGDSILADGDYWDERDRLNLDHTVEEARRLMADLEAQGIPVTARARVSGELVVYYDPFPEDGSLQVQIYGIDVATQDDVFDYHNVIAAGRWFEAGADGGGRGDNPPEVVLGGWLAEDIGAEVGFPVTIVTQTKRGFRQTIDATVVGIMECPNPVINRSAVIFPLSVLDTFLQLDGSATELVFPQLSEQQGEYVAQFARSAAARDGQVDAEGRQGALARVPFETLAEEFFAFAEADSSGNQIMLFVIFVIAAVGVSNTMLMSVLERSREIGMLQAIGMSRRQIYIMFLYEATGIGLLGGLIGIAIGAILNIFFVRYGIDYGALLRDIDVGYRVLSVFRGAWRFSTFAGALCISVIVATLTAIVPVRRILRRRSITDNLRAH